MFKELLNTIIERTEGSLGALIMGTDGIAVEKVLGEAGMEACSDRLCRPREVGVPGDVGNPRRFEVGPNTARKADALIECAALGDSDELVCPGIWLT